jgi:hypothetical protein
MPVMVRCPKCGKELVAPDALIGKVAACPQCNLTFPLVGSGRPATSTSAATPAVPPPASAGSGNASSSGKVPITTASISTNLPPAPTVPAHASPPPRPDVRSSNSGSVASVSPNAVKQEPRSQKSASPAVSSTSAGTRVPGADAPATPPTETAHTANRARFVTANPTERRINLGADGRLPELVLQEGTKAEQVPTASRGANPLVLVGVLAVSFGLSAVMLLMDTETRRSESDKQAEARAELALHYTQTHRRLEPYQEELRRALQFHNQGKYAEEHRCYRRVLDLLHEEHRDNLKGLTGVRHGTSPPSDQHLESLLSQLLSDS